MRGCVYAVIASHPVGAKRRRMTGSAKQSIPGIKKEWTASLALAMTMDRLFEIRIGIGSRGRRRRRRTPPPGSGLAFEFLFTFH
jgi:hypothetical protein